MLKDLNQVFDFILQSEGCLVGQAYFKSVKSPAHRFWVSEEYAQRYVKFILSGQDISVTLPKKREAYYEIARRVKFLLEEYPELSMSDAVTNVVYSQAPEFYIDARSAQVMLSGFRKLYCKRGSPR